MMDILGYGLIVSVLGAFGALFLKKGAKKFTFKNPVNKNIVAGFITYVLTTVVFVLGVKKTTLSFFYPFTSLLYLFAAVLGIVVLKEKVTKWRLAGICCVIAGVVMVSVAQFA